MANMPIQRRQLLISDDSALLKQIQPTQAPEVQYLDCKPVLKMVEEMFNLAMAEVKQVDGKTVKTEVTTATEGEKPQQESDFNLPADISQIINRLSIEATYSDGVDAHSKTMFVLNILSSFSWEAKVVISLAALALDYGKYLLLSEVYLSEKLPEPIVILKGLGDIRQHSEKLKSQLSQLNNLIVSMLDLAKCIVEFTELLAASSSLDVKAFSSASDAIMSATYWTIRGALASASNMSLEGITPSTELLDLPQLAEKMGKMKEQLQNQLSLYREHIVEKTQRDTFETLNLMIGMQHIDNLKVLEALLCVKEDQPPLYDGSNKTTVNLDVLKKKTVLLMISGLDITEHPDMILLNYIHQLLKEDKTSVENEFEVVWLPILDPLYQWTPEMEKMLESARTKMPWYSVNHPNMIDQPVINFIKDRFQYQGQPIVVVLDPHGMMENTNAIDMMWIWRIKAAPFSQAKEQDLWKDEILGLQMLIFDIPPEIEHWVKEGKYTVLYGGDDVEWIRKFVRTTKEVRQAANIPLEMVYVGRSGMMDPKMNSLIDVVKDEGGSHFLPDNGTIWYFWIRIEHMKRSKIRLMSSSTVGQDPVLQVIAKLQSYDQTGEWASIFKGNELVEMGAGALMLTAMEAYSKASQENANKEFDVAFKEYFDSSIPPGVTRFILPSNLERNIDVIICPECSRNMEKYILFSCQHGQEQ